MIEELELPAVGERASIGPGAESVTVELWAADPNGARWDVAVWDGGSWAALGWQSVGCDVTEATYRWGAAGEAGILSLATAGELDLETRDPDRTLDPLNTSSPYYGAVKPGQPVRIVGWAPGPIVAWTGYIDEAIYDLASEVGRIRAVDGLAYLAQAQVPDGAVLAGTLRARVRDVVRLAGLSAIVPVQPETAAGNVMDHPGAEGFPDAYNVVPPGWRISAGAGTFGTSSSATHAGSRAYNVRSCTAVNDALQASQAVAGGTAYVFGGYRLRESWADSSLDSTIHWYGASGYISGTAGPSWPAGEAADTWTRRTVTVTAPAGATGCAVQWVGTGGSEWLDDWEITGIVPGDALEADPPVAPHDAKAAPAWELIARAQGDALWYVWVGPDGVLRFRSWGAFLDSAFAGIGCPPPDALPEDEWLEGLRTIGVRASADAIRNSVRAYSSGTTWAAAITDGPSLERYGPRPFDVERVVPDRATWAARILADRADAGLEVAVGELRPYNQAELAALLTTGPSIVRVRDDAHGDPIDLDLAYIGATVGVTPLGWRWQLVAALSRVEWDDIDPEPPDPIPPDPGRPYHTETRTYQCTGDTLLALTSGGSKYGAGASDTLPVGAWSGWTYRAALKFAAIPWGTVGAAGEVRAVKAARLNVRTTTQVRVGFGSSPKAKLRRITSSWNEGSSSSPSSGNATVWPGPSTTSSGETTVTLPTGENAERDLTCTAIVKAWAPTRIGGSGAAQYGIMLQEYGSSTSNTGEVWPRENGTSAARPVLEVDVEVYDA